MRFLWFYKKKYKGLEHYEEVRDKLTLREEEQEEEYEYNLDIGKIIGILLGLFIMVFIAIGVVNPVIQEVTIVANQPAVTSILNFFPIFIAITIIIVILNFFKS